MRCTTAALVAAAATLAALCVTMANALPVPQEELQSQALDRLVMVEAENEEALRSKRTIGVLRQLFPGLSQIVEQKVSAITSELFRTLGPILLRGALGGGGSGGGGDFTGGGSNGKLNDAGTTVTVASPFGDDAGQDSDSGQLSSTSQNGSRVSIALPTFPPEDDDAEGSGTSATASSSDVNPEPEAENQVGAESQANEVRVQFADDQTASGANAAVAPELAPLDDIEVADDNRNKRFLNFGLGGGASALTGASAGSGNAAPAAGGGSGGGSGNFLFDIIRQTADGAARAAGTVYRVVAGTQSLGVGLSASRDVAPAPAAAVAPAPAAPAPKAGPAPAPAPAPAPGGAPAAPAPAPAPAPASGPAPVAGPAPPAPASGQAGPGLVAGSGSTEQGDAAANAPGRANDGTQEAVPGPITRLFVIANRGISNLVQDLILRLAATSERIVNFKAKLITSII